MNRNCTIPNRAKQTGAVLIVSLMLLIIMTMIGVTSMRTTVMEEKMAGNTRDSTLAFHAAESALLDGENFLQNTINALAVAFAGNQLGLYALGTDPDLFNAATWANSRAIATPYADVASQPRYIIELTGQMEGEGSLGSFEFNDNSNMGIPYTFRVTARGSGGTDNAVVLLQSNFVRTF